MSNDEVLRVSTVKLIDLTGVRDAGMRALILLARSLDWNVLQKINQPVVITAPDGTQKRLPTNTSIRLSVFQTTLSTIMAHTPDREPTIELIDEIVRISKVDKDHERRLRLAVGETLAEHRQRMAVVAPAQDREEPLTQRIEIPEMETENEVHPEHGKLISRKPFMAHYSGGGSSPGYLYESDASNELAWEDGAKTYECRYCGKVFATPRGAGSHKQQHIRSGETTATNQTRTVKASGGRRFKPEPKPATRVAETAEPEPEPEPEPDEEATELLLPEDILDQIRFLIMPDLVNQNERLIEELASLRAAHKELLARHEQLLGNWKALRELLDQT